MANRPRVDRPALARPLDVSVVICSYREERWSELCAAIESVSRQHAHPAEVIVVVDHNPSLAARAKRRWPAVSVVESTGAPGLSGARNTGVGRATSSIVAFLDDDATAAADWLANLHASYEDRRVVAAGGAIRPRWEDRRPYWFPTEFDWVVGCTYAGMPDQDAAVRNVIGANMSFRRQALLEGGGFSEDLGRLEAQPLGCEETAACIGAVQTREGGLVLYRPKAVVHHVVPTARSTWRYFIARCYAEGRSKAKLRRLVGGDAALSSERAYVRSTLPRAIARYLAEGLRGDGAAFARAAAIVFGLWLTAGGYLTERIGEDSVLARRRVTARSRSQGS
jgi:GT2 family glycosyltransferase